MWVRTTWKSEKHRKRWQERGRETQLELYNKDNAENDKDMTALTMWNDPMEWFYCPLMEENMKEQGQEWEVTEHRLEPATNNRT